MADGARFTSLQASAALATSGLLGPTDVNATLLRVVSCLSSAMLPADESFDRSVESKFTEADVSMLSQEPRAAIHPIAAGILDLGLILTIFSSTSQRQSPVCVCVCVGGGITAKVDAVVYPWRIRC